MTVSNNVVGTTQFGIVTVTEPTSPSPDDPNGVADHTVITNNQILNTEIFDAIDVCSNANNVQGNVIANATKSGIHLDSSCGSTGVKNSVKHNAVNESCAGILVGATPNAIEDNIFFNVVNTTLTGNACPATTAPAVSARTAITISKTAHPAPVR